MPTINDLTSLDKLSAGDQLPVYSDYNGDARKATLSILLDFISENLLSEHRLVTQYFAPKATGFSVEVADDTHLIVTPDDNYAAGEIVLPNDPKDKSEVLVNITKNVTALTVDGRGKYVVAVPASISANDYFRLKYDALGGTWYRVG